MRKAIVLPVAVGLSLVLLVAWFYLSLPSLPQYETLLYGKFKLSPKGSHSSIMDWLSYEFTISERTELVIGIEVVEPEGSGGLLWHLYNSTKETIANTTNMNSVLLLIRHGGLHSTILLNETGDYTFALLTLDFTTTVLLDLSARPSPIK